VLGLRSHGNR